MARERMTGTQAITDRFAGARALWSLTARNSDGYVNAFTVTAFSVNGRVVLVQEFADNCWDAYVPASDSGEITVTLDDVAKRVGLQ